MLTLIAFMLLGLLVVAACETTRGFLRRLINEEHAVTDDAPILTPAPGR